MLLQISTGRLYIEMVVITSVGARFGLDEMVMINGSAKCKNFPSPPYTGGPVIENEDDYLRLLPLLYSDEKIDAVLEHAGKIKKYHEQGEIVVRLWLDGHFWHPRELLGIEKHLYSFYDIPDLLHEINTNLVDYNIKVLNELLKVLKPDMVGLAEDMSYNNGPMLSEASFNEFIKPYYVKFVSAFSDKDIKIFVDSDGYVNSMIPWLLESGINGIYPLERQSKVDVNEIREKYPKFLMMGGYDKMVMSKGEKCMREEFERILPAMVSGGYIPSVDHQTPPEVSLDNYTIYLRLLSEYTARAAELAANNNMQFKDL